MTQPLFLKFLIVIAYVCHNYTAHIPENFALLFHASTTISLCDFIPILHDFTQTNTKNLPTNSNTNLPPTNLESPLFRVSQLEPPDTFDDHGWPPQAPLIVNGQY